MMPHSYVLYTSIIRRRNDGEISDTIIWSDNEEKYMSDALGVTMSSEPMLTVIIRALSVFLSSGTTNLSISIKNKNPDCSMLSNMSHGNMVSMSMKKIMERASVLRAQHVHGMLSLLRDSSLIAMSQRRVAHEEIYIHSFPNSEIL